jgi:hypothetical protein
VPTAYVHIRETPHYRRDSFTQGLSRLGYTVVTDTPKAPLDRKDVVVCWNKTARSTQAISFARLGGAAVIITENGYYGRDENGIAPFALALDGHNGSGRWFCGGPERLSALNIDFKPLRMPREGRVLVAGQRGIGSNVMRSPWGFDQQASNWLRSAGYEPKVRLHPGDRERTATPPPLMEDLADCDALVVWSSNCATEALIAGVPTYFMAPTIVTAGAATMLSVSNHDLPLPHVGEPFQAAFERMAWGQWSVRELSSGEPFRLLLAVHAEALPSCMPGIDRS